MAWTFRGVCLLLALTAANAMHCKPQPLFPWIPDPAGIDVGDPWNTYPSPERECCVEGASGTFDAQAKCHICYERTKSTPGFAADPNNCQNFYMCEPDGEDGWNVFNMTCPICEFWNQDLLTCVQVFNDPYYCGMQTHVTYPISRNTFDEEALMFCIDFEDADLVSDSVGVYRPWILNDGVTTVDNSMGVTCPQGQRCGFFNESVLEVAFFSNNYAQWPSLRITLDYMMIASTSIDQGIISNDCFNGADYAAGNSLYCSADSDTFNGGLRGTGVIGDVDLSATSQGMNSWGAVEMNWVNGNLVLSTPAGNAGPSPFDGLIRESHCPLMIGAFIKERIPSYFQGYMDNICFYKW